MVLKHGFGTVSEKMVRSGIRSTGVSTKASIMMCKLIRGMRIVKAKAKLEAIAKLEEPLPFTRFTDGVGHRRGQLASGRFPQKTALVFLKLIANLQNNAQQKGLGEDLFIVHAVANHGTSRGKFGRQARRSAKSTHIDIVAEEVVVAATKETQKQTTATAKPASSKPKAPAKEPQAAKKEVAQKPQAKPEEKVEVKKEAPKVEVKKEVVKETPKEESKEKVPEAKPEVKPKQPEAKKEPAPVAEKKPEKAQEENKNGN